MRRVNPRKMRLDSTAKLMDEAAAAKRSQATRRGVLWRAMRAKKKSQVGRPLGVRLGGGEMPVNRGGMRGWRLVRSMAVAL